MCVCVCEGVCACVCVWVCACVCVCVHMFSYLFCCLCVSVRSQPVVAEIPASCRAGCPRSVELAWECCECESLLSRLHCAVLQPRARRVPLGAADRRRWAPAVTSVACQEGDRQGETAEGDQVRPLVSERETGPI